MSSNFGIIDLFAGPGGLAEGFASIRTHQGLRPFSIVLSVEKEESAYQTLLLRNFLRQFRDFPKEYYAFLNDGLDEPDWETLYPDEWTAATHETLRLELGSKFSVNVIDARLKEIRARFKGNTVLIGGPPCQAYSLVGRARNKGVAGYEASQDHRHFLYQEYIRILDKLRPAIFVMENVKGILSSSIDGARVFDRVLDDLNKVGDGAYHLVPLAPRSDTMPHQGRSHPSPNAFIVRAEELGLPQARHRVIVVGIRSDLISEIKPEIFKRGLLNATETVVVRDVLLGMPKLRSGLSGGNDSEEAWRKAVVAQIRRVARIPLDLPAPMARAIREEAKSIADRIANSRTKLARIGNTYSGVNEDCPRGLRRWLVDGRLKSLPNNETRGHMVSDLGRYFFAALYGKLAKTSPKAESYPKDLAPDHRNWNSGKFADRFRVQLWDSPATTITSHISKDGHYFIHPDPSQCRSLTVREAARLQTFPDNYLFKGNRTQQYVQVGNAVPPYLARKIAESVHKLLESDANPSNNARMTRKRLVGEAAE